jgi:hypothetical protein
MAPLPLTTAVGNGRFVTVFEQMLVHPLPLVNVRVSVKLPEAPALALTDCALVPPVIVPLPAMDQRYAVIPAGAE